MKKWYESRTIWLNVLGFIVIALEYFGTINFGDPEIMTALLALANIAVRFVTEAPIAKTVR